MTEPDPQLEGEFGVEKTVTGEVSLYPPKTEKVRIEYGRDGYYNVWLFDADGTRLGCHGHRPEHRIRGALDTESGTYSIKVNEGS